MNVTYKKVYDIKPLLDRIKLKNIACQNYDKVVFVYVRYRKEAAGMVSAAL